MDGTFELYESVFLLWTPAMEQPVKVDTVCSSLDILPTLLNLFGFEYDSRLLMGTDVFSGTAPTVVFADKKLYYRRDILRCGERPCHPAHRQGPPRRNIWMRACKG